MTRTALTDGSNKWFDKDTAVCFQEHSWWNGNNHISRATGSQWNHEYLYYTKSGRWVLNAWSNYQNVPETYEEMAESDAIDWLIRQEKMEDKNLPKLPEQVQERVRAQMANAEI